MLARRRTLPSMLEPPYKLEEVPRCKKVRSEMLRTACHRLWTQHGAPETALEQQPPVSDSIPPSSLELSRQNS
jgi:hypothetical protein